MSVRKTKFGTFELRICSKLLPKDYYRNFKTREDAEGFEVQVRALLKQGIVPVSLMEAPEAAQTGWPLLRCVSEYLANNPVADSDKRLLATIETYLSMFATHHVNYEWVEAWLRKMKREENLSPSTIRHRIGALSRCLDYINKKKPGVLAVNPIHLLKRGYSQYNDDDQRAVEGNGKKIKVDEERNRRLDPAEEAALVKLLARDPDALALFKLALETAMRMREMYTLTTDQVNLERATIFLDKTKNGDARQVPLSSVAREVLRKYMQDNAKAIMARGRRIFPWCGGSASQSDLARVTAYLSKLFANVFDEAKLEDLHFHDLRHEATCRLFLRTTLSDTEIARITGHKDLRMLKRYASLRGSELAARMW